MKFKPVNRHLLVKPLEEEKEESTVLIPETSKQKPVYGCCEVLAIAGDCTREIRAGHIAIINNAMLEEVNIMDETFYLILENHVIGVTSD